MHKILAKYWQNYIFMTTCCQFSSLTYQYIGKNNKNTKNLSTAISRQPFVRFGPNLRIKFSLLFSLYRPILISNTTTFLKHCGIGHLKN